MKNVITVTVFHGLQTSISRIPKLGISVTIRYFQGLGIAEIQLLGILSGNWGPCMTYKIRKSQVLDFVRQFRTKIATLQPKNLEFGFT